VRCALGGAPLLKPADYDELVAVLKDPEAAGISEKAAAEAAPRVGDILVAQGKVDRDQVERAVAEHPGDPVGVALVKSQAVSVSDVGQALRASEADARPALPAVEPRCASAPSAWTG
jgi:two-component system, chemotaxis family, sensor kinase CheA